MVNFQYCIFLYCLRTVQETVSIPVRDRTSAAKTSNAKCKPPKMLINTSHNTKIILLQLAIISLKQFNIVDSLHSIQCLSNNQRYFFLHTSVLHNVFILPFLAFSCLLFYLLQNFPLAICLLQFQFQIALILDIQQSEMQLLRLVGIQTDFLILRLCFAIWDRKMIFNYSVF